MTDGLTLAEYLEPQVCEMRLQFHVLGAIVVFMVFIVLLNGGAP